MIVAKKKLRKFQETPENKHRVTIYFAECLRNKEQRDLTAKMNGVIADNKQAFWELA